MTPDAGSIALFGLSAYGFKLSGLSNPKYIRAIKIVSVVVLAMVVWDSQRVNYSSQVTSLALSALLYSQVLPVLSGLRFISVSRRKHRDTHHRGHRRQHH